MTVDISISRFIQAAYSYCRLVEDGGSENSWQFAHECLITVLELYRAALLLPETEPDSVFFDDAVGHDLWDATRRRLQEKLSRDYYWEAYEPLESDQPETLLGSLSDDLADIWRDIKRGLEVVAAHDLAAIGANTLAQAVWHWRFSLETHWGQHASGAINCLHALCFGPFADTSRPRSAEANS